MALKKKDNRRQGGMMLIVLVYLILFAGGLLFFAKSGKEPSYAVVLLPVLFVLAIYLAMPKEQRKEWRRGTGLFIKGKQINFRKKK